MLNLLNQKTSINQYTNLPITKTLYYPTLDKRNSSFFNEKKSFNQIFSSYTFAKTENKNSPRIPYCQKTTFRKSKCISNNVSTEYDKSICPSSIIRRSSLHEILIRKRKNQREEIKLLLQKPTILVKQSIRDIDFKKANAEEKMKSNIHNFRKIQKIKGINNQTNYTSVSTNSKYSSSQKARFNTSFTKYPTEIENKLTDFEKKEILKYKNTYYYGEKIAKATKQKTGLSNHGFDNEKQDYICIVGDHIAYRYEILSLLGKGTYGIVF